MDLRNYLGILWRKRWVVLAASLSTFIATIVFTIAQTPTYRASATFIITPATAYEDMRSLVADLEALSRRSEIARTYAEVADSRLIKQQAADELGLSQALTDDLSVASELLVTTNVIEITAEGSDPELVSLFSNMVGAKTTAYVQQLYEAYGLESLDPASAPRSPVKPNIKLNLALAAVLGLALGAGLAFLAEHLDTRLHTSEQIQAVTESPILGQIPTGRNRGRQMTHFLGDGYYIEAFLRLRTHLFTLDQELPLKTVLVTSAQPEEGKSTIVAHLAMSIAQSGRKAIAVDCDLRRPALHKIFDLPNGIGLSNILLQEATLAEAVQSNKLSKVQVLTSGPLPPTPISELLCSPQMTALIEELTQQFDMVLIDTPSFLAVTDAAVLAPVADGVLLVVGRAQIRREALRAARLQLADAKASLLGVVVNRMPQDLGNRYYDHYHRHGSTRKTKEPLAKVSGIGPVYEKALNALSQVLPADKVEQIRDPLTEISGIGPVWKRVLNRLGVFTFEQLAGQDPEDLAGKMRARITAERIRKDRWVEQARAIALRKQHTQPPAEERTPESAQ